MFTRQLVLPHDEPPRRWFGWRRRRPRRRRARRRRLRRRRS